jgi:DNA-binding NarL/FixJ family response regulator
MPASETIKVLIVDDHPVVRLGLRTMLESEKIISVVGAVGSGSEALVEVGKVQPDVVLMDLRMPEMEGIEAIEQLRRIQPEIRILVLTNYEQDEYVFRALRAGAMGYLLKITPQEEIVQAVEAVSQNKQHVPPKIAQRLLQTIQREELSQREFEVLSLMAQGLMNKEIAQRLFISDNTVRNHVASCMTKLGAKDRTQAVTTAIRRGLIRLSE